MIIINEKDSNLNEIEKFNEYCKFKKDELKVNLIVLDVFCIYFFSKNEVVRKMLKLNETKKKGILNLFLLNLSFLFYVAFAHILVIYIAKTKIDK